MGFLYQVLNFAPWRFGGIKSESAKDYLPQRREGAKVRKTCLGDNLLRFLKLGVFAP
jgi:hypothetical protein